MELTRFALVSFRSHSPKRRSMRQLHERCHQHKMETKTDSPTRHQFYDLQTEYANIISDSETSIISEFSSTMTEGGYLSDVSDVFTLSTVNMKVSRKLRTKQELDNYHPQKPGSTSDEESINQKRKFVRKPKQKEPKSVNSNHDYKSTLDGKLLYNEENENQERRSLTDSGVSLSRTDHSRCGTISKDGSPIKSDASCSSSDKMFRVDTRRDFYDDFESDGASSFKETDETGDTTTQESIEQLKNISPCLRRGYSQNSGKTDLNTNRLSLITNRSSLTNVTTMSTTPSSCRTSLSSFGEYTSCNYVSSATESKQNDSDTENESKRGSYIERVPVSDCKGSNVSVINKDTVDGETCSVASHDSKSDSQKLTNVIQTVSGSLNQTETRRRGSGIIHGFKKVKDHLTPKMFTSKQPKDASSEFSYEKKQSDKNRQAFEELTAHVFGKLAHLQTDDDNFKRLSAALDVSTEIKHKDEAKTEPVLDKLASRPSKQKNSWKNLFRKSRSFSAERIAKKSKIRDSFKRNTKERSSLRSNPDQQFPSKATNIRVTKSLDNIQGACPTPSLMLNNSIEKARSNSIADWSSRSTNDLAQSSNSIPRCVSLTELQEDGSLEIVTKRRANTTPNTPSFSRSNISDDQHSVYGLNSYENNCDCDNCLYADYMDYLAFQQFKRCGGLNNFYDRHQFLSFVPNTDHKQQSYQHHQSSEHFHTINVTPEKVIAPLSVQKGEEKEAKTLKTAMFDTFV